MQGNRTTIGFALGLLLAAAPCALVAQTYKAVGSFKVNGATVNSIAVDSDARRIYAATSNGVMVLNADTGAAIGEIAGLKNATAVLLIPAPVAAAAEDEDDAAAKSEAAPAAITRGFAADAAGNVIAFNVADMKESAKSKVPAGGFTSLCYDDEANAVEAVSADGALATINAASGRTERSGKLATGAGQVVCGTLHHVYVADTAANVVRVLNGQTLHDDGDIPVMNGRQPSGIALDTKGRRLFVGCENGTIDVIDTDAGFTFAELKGGTGAARELFTWLPQGPGQWKAAAFIAQQDGTLSGVRMNAYINYTLGGSYKLTPGLGAIAFDAKTRHLLIASTDAGTPSISVVGY